jgi:flagella synthesis protein FlgN
VNSETRHSLALCLGRELESIERLLGVLRAEHAALGGHDAARIDEAVTVKNAALAELDAIGKERDRLMREAGFDPRRPDSAVEAQQWRDIMRAWRRLLELGEQCLQQNSINGALIQSGLRHTRQLLSVLRGQRPDECTASYGPRAGGSVEGPAPRALGKA